MHTEEVNTADLDSDALTGEYWELCVLLINYGRLFAYHLCFVGMTLRNLTMFHFQTSLLKSPFRKIGHF